MGGKTENKSVKCVETNVIYYSIGNASKLTNINVNCISRCLNGKQKTAGGYHWELVNDNDILEIVEHKVIKCNMDCFNCPFPDCINDYVAPYDYEYQKEYRKKYRDKINLRKRQLKEERKLNGMCVECGKFPITENSKSKCYTCLSKDRVLREKKRRDKGILPRELFDGVNLCSTCGKNKPVDGYKECESCLEKHRKNIAIGRSMRKNNSFRKNINGNYKESKN